MILTKKIFPYILIFIAFSSCKKNELKYERSEERKQYDLRNSDDYNVSVVRLIASPEKYDKKKIQVVGFLNLQFEGTAIYMNESDFKTGSQRNAFWVVFADSIESKIKKNNFYHRNRVLLEGTFDKNDLGHGSLFGGTIRNITRIDTMKIR